jgi:hypothetical protein
MRKDSFAGRLVAALSRNTPAFRPVPKRNRAGKGAQLLAALSRSTPAFDPNGPLNHDISDADAVDLRTIRSDHASDGSEFVNQTPIGVELPRRDPYFTGRQEELAKLADALATVEDRTVRVALVGMGGVGKSTLALEYVHRHLNRYDSITWVSSPERELVYRRLLQVRQRLRHYERWLLVLDNIEEPQGLREQGFVQALSRMKGGHVLVTSRMPRIEASDALIEVKPFSSEEAESFLRARIPQSDRRMYSELVRELEALPLALAIAASYIEQTNLSAADFMTEYRRLRAQLRRVDKTVGPNEVALELLSR